MSRAKPHINCCCTFQQMSATDFPTAGDGLVAQSLLPSHELAMMGRAATDLMISPSISLPLFGCTQLFGLIMLLLWSSIVALVFVPMIQARYNDLLSLLRNKNNCTHGRLIRRAQSIVHDSLQSLTSKLSSLTRSSFDKLGSKTSLMRHDNLITPCHEIIAKSTYNRDRDSDRIRADSFSLADCSETPTDIPLSKTWHRLHQQHAKIAPERLPVTALIFCTGEMWLNSIERKARSHLSSSETVHILSLCIASAHSTLANTMMVKQSSITRSRLQGNEILDSMTLSLCFQPMIRFCSFCDEKILAMVRTDTWRMLSLLELPWQKKFMEAHHSRLRLFPVDLNGPISLQQLSAKLCVEKPEGRRMLSCQLPSFLELISLSDAESNKKAVTVLKGNNQVFATKGRAPVDELPVLGARSKESTLPPPIPLRRRPPLILAQRYDSFGTDSLAPSLHPRPSSRVYQESLIPSQSITTSAGYIRYSNHAEAIDCKSPVDFEESKLPPVPSLTLHCKSPYGSITGSETWESFHARPACVEVKQADADDTPLSLRRAYLKHNGASIQKPRDNGHNSAVATDMISPDRSVANVTSRKGPEFPLSPVYVATRRLPSRQASFGDKIQLCTTVQESDMEQRRAFLISEKKKAIARAAQVQTESMLRQRWETMVMQYNPAFDNLHRIALRRMQSRARLS